MVKLVTKSVSQNCKATCCAGQESELQTCGQGLGMGRGNSAAQNSRAVPDNNCRVGRQH